MSSQLHGAVLGCRITRTSSTPRWELRIFCEGDWRMPEARREGAGIRDLLAASIIRRMARHWRLRGWSRTSKYRFGRNRWRYPRRTGSDRPLRASMPTCGSRRMAPGWGCGPSAAKETRTSSWFPGHGAWRVEPWGVGRFSAGRACSPSVGFQTAGALYSRVLRRNWATTTS